MKQNTLLDVEDHGRINVGGGFQLEIYPGKKGESTGKVHLDCRVVAYRNARHYETVDFKDHAAKRVFVVELVDKGAVQAQVADALDLSRQSIHNWRESKKYFGLQGVINNYKVSESKSLSKQRKGKASQLGSGNNARELEALRKKNREERESQQLAFDFSCCPGGKEETVSPAVQVYSGVHDWKQTRYAGVFLYVVSLVANWNWLALVQGFFGSFYHIFVVFLLMAARNIRSLEQLKNVRFGECAVLLGLPSLPARENLWQWFYQAAAKKRSQLLLRAYFLHQVRAGLVSVWLWFTDGHLLPYSGKNKIHKAYNTQRRMPFPGQTSLVSCDGTGRIVDFSIEEGKGDLRQRMFELADQWSDELKSFPVMVFDREGSGLGFFSELVKQNICFATWEKYANKKRIEALPAEKFTESFSFNGKDYRFFEEEKLCEFQPDEAEKEAGLTFHKFVLRRFVIWNLSSNRRASGLAWDGRDGVSKGLTGRECAEAILSRWGASENTFKHLNDRHPLHYHPGFKLVNSDKQLISNPAIEESAGKISGLKTKLSKLYRDAAKVPEVTNKDGSVRCNSKKQRLSEKTTDLEKQMSEEQVLKAQLTEKVDVSTLENYSSFKRIDNEGKHLFDFVTASVWNARKQMVDWLRQDFTNNNEVVDLFYAISDCHGWIKTTSTDVVVRLEPLQQPRRRTAQERLCKKLSQLGAMTPNGKWLSIEVGKNPTMK